MKIWGYFGILFVPVSRLPFRRVLELLVTSADASKAASEFSSTSWIYLFRQVSIVSIHESHHDGIYQVFVNA